MRTRSFPAASESPAVLREVLAPERVSPPARSQSTYSVCGVIECVWLPCTLPGASVHAQANVLKYYSILFYFLSSSPPPPPPPPPFPGGRDREPPSSPQEPYGDGADGAEVLFDDGPPAGDEEEEGEELFDQNFDVR